MKQLVELQKQAKQFHDLDAEVVVVYREERSGVAGLKRIKAVSKTTFTLAVDLNKESSRAYSSKKSDFSSYVIDKAGKIQKIVPGTKASRATTGQLLKALKGGRESS